MKTSASLFTGGGLFDIGAIAAGYEIIWGIEKIDKISAIARLNGLPVMTADVTEVDFSTLQRPDHLHASPPCLNFSIAKNGAIETELDIAMAQAVCRALVTSKPDTFTLENVVGYRNSQSFQFITKTLNDMGYWWDAENLNSADFGVPQTRIRLWVRASNGLLRGYPEPVKWKGWYEAIEDLIPSLSDTDFAPWQLARLPEEYKEFIIGQGTYSSALEPHEPVQTITSNNNQSAIKAFIVGGANTSDVQAAPGVGVSYYDEPIRVVATNSASWRAFVMQVQGQSVKGYKDEGEPMQALMGTHSAGKYRAFILDGQLNEGERITIRDDDQPIFTQSSSASRPPARAYVGRVVKMDIRCLGRFQTVPDSYRGLTVKINGNGVPCLMAQKILETL